MSAAPTLNPAPAAPDAQAPLLVADDLSRHYRVSRGLFQPQATVRALNGVSFTLQRGRTLGVVGESGCGKSTLARALTLVEAPTAGRLQIAGTEVTTADAARRRWLRTQVQMVFQNPYGSLNPRKRIAQMLDEPLKLNTPLTAAERQERVLRMLETVGLRAEHAQRYPHMFSGGQRQRIAIARALMLSPPLLVADEPTSALDVSVQAQILNLLRDLQRERQLGYVFISHNLGVIEHLADEVMVMYLGRVVERAPKAALFARPLHPYSQVLWAAVPRLDGARRVVAPAADLTPPSALRSEPPSPLNLPPGCAFHQRCPLADARCRAELPALRPAGAAGQWVACHRVEEG
ncbi:MAG: dipeptide ABC transporter ATP-binding protein [Burkholderiaceae bacterium]|nr:dipeptide ABC transporter ATP-binding protein [Burkholderiaceae bacterium]